MKIAVTYENGNVFQHFGHTGQFKIYETDGKQILRSEVVSTDGQGHGALSTFLAERGIDVLLCGGIGGGAQMALKEVVIQLYGGVSGNADDQVQAFLDGALAYNANVRCDHHDHEHNGAHACGSHGCGNHDCH